MHLNLCTSHLVTWGNYLVVLYCNIKRVISNARRKIYIDLRAFPVSDSAEIPSWRSSFGSSPPESFTHSHLAPLLHSSVTLS